jgi:hypothetical protein
VNGPDTGVSTGSEDAQLARRAATLARWAVAQRDRQLADLYARLAAAHTDRHLHAPAEDRCAICRHEHPPYTRCCDLCHYKTFRLP